MSIESDRRNAHAALSALSPTDSMRLTNILMGMEDSQSGIQRAMAACAILGMADVELNGQPKPATSEVAPKRVENLAATPKIALALPPA